MEVDLRPSRFQFPVELGFHCDLCDHVFPVRIGFKTFQLFTILPRVSETVPFPSPVWRLTLCLPALKLKEFSAYLSK